MGFLKKLPALPVSSGRGSLLHRTEVMVSASCLAVGVVMPCWARASERALYCVLGEKVERRWNVTDQIMYCPLRAFLKMLSR